METLIPCWLESKREAQPDLSILSHHPRYTFLVYTITETNTTATVTIPSLATPVTLPPLLPVPVDEPVDVPEPEPDPEPLLDPDPVALALKILT